MGLIESLERKAGRSPHQACLSMRRNQKTLLVPERVHQHLERHDSAGAVEPDVLASHRSAGNNVIELRRSRYIGIEFALKTDEDRRRLDADRLQQGGQQRVLVFAIAVAVGQNLACRVRLDAAQPEGQAHVADVARDIVIQRLYLLHVVGFSLDELSSFGLHCVVGLAPFALEKRIPGAQIVPALEGRQLYGRDLIRWARWPLLASLWILVLEVGMGPAIDAPVTFIRHFGIVTGPGLQLYMTRLRNIDFLLLVQHDARLREVIARPEMVGRQRIYDSADQFILQHIARTQGRNADVLLVIIGVNRSVGSGGQVLNGRFLRGHDRAVRLADPYIYDVQLIGGCAVANLQLAEPLHSALADDSDLGSQFLAAGPVVFIPHDLAIVFYDVGFLRIIRRNRRLDWPRLRRRGCRWQLWRILHGRQLCAHQQDSEEKKKGNSGENSGHRYAIGVNTHGTRASERSQLGQRVIHQQNVHRGLTGLRAQPNITAKWKPPPSE